MLRPGLPDELFYGEDARGAMSRGSDQHDSPIVGISLESIAATAVLCVLSTRVIGLGKKAISV